MKGLLKQNKLALLLVTFVFLLITSFFYENKVSYVHFVDEEENMVTGKYLLEGDKLYSDIFATHQPISYITSAVIQKTTNPSSIFLLIKRHREFMILWSIFWIFLLVYRFGLVGLGFSAIFESSKIFLLGNLFLSESLTVYPLVFLVAYALYPNNKLSSLGTFIIGILSSFCIFLLAPAWPLIVFLFIFLLIKNKLYREWKALLLGFLVVVILILPFISIYPDYFRDVFFFNLKYFIPLERNNFNIVSIVNSFFSFLSVFINVPKTQILLIIRFLSVALILYFALLIKTKKFKDFGLIFLLLGLANIRYIQPGQDYYRGFHLMPWYAVLIFSLSYLSTHLYKNTKEKLLKVLIMSAFLVPLIASLYSSRDELFIKRDVMNDYHINYSRQFDVGEAVRIMKSPKDTLFVVPDESLLYWQADIKRATRYIFYYPFMTDVAFAWEEVKETFDRNPPTFFYCRCDKPKIVELTNEYDEIKKDSGKTHLYVLSEKINNLTEEQKKQLNYYRFSY